MTERLRSPWTWLAVAAVVLVAIYPLLSDDLYYQNMIILSMVFAVGAVGLNIITGYAGYVSLGQGAFLGLGAYVVGIGVTKVGGSPWLWIAAAGVVAALFAALLGVVAMRARGHSFVILTIAFLFLLQIVATNWDSLTNGTGGITLPLPTWSIDIQYWPFYYSLMGILAASMLMSWWIRRNKFGMGLIAIREDEDKAATVGVNTRVYKILAFAASAVFVGMAGGVYGYYLAFIDPIGMFNILISVQIILSLLLGAARRSGARARRLHRRGAERVLEQRPRRRQLAPARLRRAAGAGGAVHVARHHPDGRRVDREVAQARQGRAGRERLSGIDLAERAAPPGHRRAPTGRHCSRSRGSSGASAGCAPSTAQASWSRRARSPR